MYTFAKKKIQAIVCTINCGVVATTLLIATSCSPNRSKGQKDDHNFEKYLNNNIGIFLNNFNNRINQTSLFKPMNNWLNDDVNHKLLFLIYDACRADGIAEATKNKSTEESAFKKMPYKYLGTTIPGCDTRTISGMDAYFTGNPYFDVCVPDTHMFRDKDIHTLPYSYAIQHSDRKVSWTNDYEKFNSYWWSDVTDYDEPPSDYPIPSEHIKPPSNYEYYVNDNIEDFDDGDVGDNTFDIISQQPKNDDFYLVSGDFDSINHGARNKDNNFATWQNSKYLDLINIVDGKVNTIINSINETSEKDNWMIILASDHGANNAGNYGGFDETQKTVWYASNQKLF